MKIFIHQRKLVAENLTKHLTNNKKRRRKQSVHDNTKVSMQITAISMYVPVKHTSQFYSSNDRIDKTKTD